MSPAIQVHPNNVGASLHKIIAFFNKKLIKLMLVVRYKLNSFHCMPKVSYLLF